MMRSLWTAASGMVAGQFHIDTIAHNLSNVNTTGFKKGRAEFEDLLYQTRRIAGTPSSELTNYPVGIQTGLGVKVGATQKFYTQGNLQNTENKLDLAIQEDGFFKVLMPNGTEAYTRDGSFKIDSSRTIVSSEGYRLQPEIQLPENFDMNSLSISQTGQITVKIPGQDDPIDVGQVNLYRFINPAGLTNIGENLVKVSSASGEAVEGTPGSDGFGQTLQGFLEMSNVNAITEMVDMIVAQRAYEFNSKAIQASDSMLATANQLKR